MKTSEGIRDKRQGIRRRPEPVTTGEASDLLSLALMTPRELKGLGYRELWLAQHSGSALSEAAQEFMRGFPLERMAENCIRWRREDGRKARRDRLKDLAIDFLVRDTFPRAAKDGAAIEAAKRELIGFAVVKLGLGHLSYAKPWLPKRRQLRPGGAQ